jgi:hypothetical protein
MSACAGSKDTGAHITNAEMDYAVPSDLSFACKPGNEHEDTIVGTSQDYSNINPATSQTSAGEFEMSHVQLVRVACCTMLSASTSLWCIPASVVLNDWIVHERIHLR